MAKTNYKAGDKIKVIKPGIFQELEGQVIAVGMSDLPFKVDLGPAGTWNFNITHIELIKNSNKNEQPKQPGKK
jgi:hypothetical protein